MLPVESMSNSCLKKKKQTPCIIQQKKHSTLVMSTLNSRDGSTGQSKLAVTEPCIIAVDCFQSLSQFV